MFGDCWQLKSNNIVNLTPENSRGGVFYWQEYYDANAYAALTPAVQLGLSYQLAASSSGDAPWPAPPASPRHRARFRVFALLFF